MRHMSAKIYFYKLTADDGGAPCVHGELLSLAICKPMIRSTATKGDLIFGFAASSLSNDNRLIYVARITDKKSNGEYFRQAQFTRRGDCIYEWHGDGFRWRRGSAHHGPHHLEHDLGPPPDYGKANVLLSDDFRYFGGDGTVEYKQKYPLVKEAVENLGRGHRVRHQEELRAEFIALKNELWQSNRRNVIGRPTSLPRRNVCHRSRSCLVLDPEEQV